MKDEEREAAVAAHLKALDDEIARLRAMEAAMDRRLDEAEQERRSIAEQLRQEGPDED
jgi:chromosome segregation ATPase